MLWNPEVHYCIYKCSLPVSILSQINPGHALTSHFLKIHFNTILSVWPGSSIWFLSLSFPHQNPVCTSPRPICYMPCPSHSYQLITQITFGEEYRSSLYSLLHLPVTFVPLRPKYPQNPILKHPQPMFLPECE